MDVPIAISCFHQNIRGVILSPYIAEQTSITAFYGLRSLWGGRTGAHGGGCVTFSGKIKRISADHSPEPVMAKLRCSVIGRTVGRPVIGQRDLCYRPCYRPSFL